MRQTKASVTARHVALTRVTLVRPELPGGDVDAEVRFYRSLGASRLSRRSGEKRRMERRTIPCPFWRKSSGVSRFGSRSALNVTL
jgi:hypothetical protein